MYSVVLAMCVVRPFPALLSLLILQKSVMGFDQTFHPIARSTAAEGGEEGPFVSGYELMG